MGSISEWLRKLLGGYEWALPIFQGLLKMMWDKVLAWNLALKTILIMVLAAIGLMLMRSIGIVFFIAVMMALAGWLLSQPDDPKPSPPVAPPEQIQKGKKPSAPTGTPMM